MEKWEKNFQRCRRSGKEGTGETSKVPPKADSKQQRDTEREAKPGSPSSPKSKSWSLHSNKSLYYKAHTMDCPLHSVTSSIK